MLYTALTILGNKDEDGNEAPFIWAKVITDKPMDEAGNPVKNPGNICIYGAKGMKSGDIESVILMHRVGGLYDLISADKAELICTKMGKKLSDLKEVPLAETRATRNGNADELSARASKRRQAKKAARLPLLDTVETELAPE